MRKFQRRWEVALSGNVTPPVVADGRLLVAEKETGYYCSNHVKTDYSCATWPLRQPTATLWTECGPNWARGRWNRDAGFLTEPQMWQRFGEHLTPFELVCQDKGYPLADLLAAADLVGCQHAWPQQLRLPSDDDDAIRYWGSVGLPNRERC